MRPLATLTGLLAVAGMTIAASPVVAGQWIRTNCVNPDQSPAPSDGWTSFTVGAPSIGSTNKTICGPGDPMVAFLSMGSAAPRGAAEVLQYTPPDGSTLVGGTAFVGLSAYGHGVGAAAAAAMYTPALAHDASNVFLQCVLNLWPCQHGLPEYYGQVDLPRDRGGSLYIGASCLSGGAGTYCSQGGSRGTWSAVAMGWANLVLSTTSLPSGTEFGGTLLEPGAHGTATLVFTAADGGPGVYKVTVTMDGEPIYDATPNRNDGKCVPVGYDANAKASMWAWQQPCPKVQPVDLRVGTTALRDGAHELVVSVTNAGANTSTVLRRTITTNNRTIVSARLTSDKVPTAGALLPVSTYSVALDAQTRAFRTGVKRSWPRSAIELSGTLRTSAGMPASGVLVTLFARNAGGRAVRTVARTTTDAVGHWVVVAPRGPSRTLMIDYGEQPDPASARAIKIHQTVSSTVSMWMAPAGDLMLNVTGEVRPHAPGTSRPFVSIQVKLKKHWTDTGGAFRVDPFGSYRVTVTAPGGSGARFFEFRSFVHATPRYAGSFSPIRKVKVG